MGFVHGKGVAITINAIDLSAFANNVQMPREADTHDVTTYGNVAHRYQGGLFDGTCTVQGVYDDGVGGPQAVLEPLLSTTVPVIYRPEGVGAGKPSKAFSAVVGSYEETAPVADMITWQCELQIDGAVTVTAQV